MVIVLPEAPEGFKTIATTNDGEIAAIGNEEHQIYGLQFYPEVPNLNMAMIC